MLLAGPAITASLIIFVYPYPAKFAYEYARKRQKEQDIARLRSENDGLTSKITTLENKQSEHNFVPSYGLVEPKKLDPELPQGLTPTQNDLLIQIALHGEKVSIVELIHTLEGSKIAHEYDRDKLVEYGYAKSYMNGEYVRTTEAGRAYLIENKLII